MVPVDDPAALPVVRVESSRTVEEHAIAGRPMTDPAEVMRNAIEEYHADVLACVCRVPSAASWEYLREDASEALAALVRERNRLRDDLSAAHDALERDDR